MPSPRRRAQAVRSLWLAALSFSWIACRSEQPEAALAKESAPESATEKKPAVDQKIANAMAAAAEESARSAEGAGNGAGAPPPDGIMTREAALEELPVGAAATVVLGNEGASPRLKIGPERLTAGASPAGKLELSYRSGGSVMPTVEFELKGKISAADAAMPGGALVTRFVAAKARPSEQQPGRLPDNARAEIAKLDGSAIEFVTSPKGAVIASRHELAGNNPELEPFVMGSAEALGNALLPYPDVPVGVGAFWMVKSRETANGADVLAYRMVRVTEVAGDTLKLSVSTRRYLLSESLPVAGFPPHRVRQFQSEGDGSLSLHAGSSYPDSAEVHDTFVAVVTPNDRPNQAMPVQSELKAKISFGK